MKRKLLIFLSLFIMASMLNAQKIPLNYNDNGKFKIIQFTDVHYKKGVPESERAIELLNEALDAEKPDMVIFTGDIVYAKPVIEGLDDVFAPVIERKIPWAYVFGNHDDEFGTSRQEIMDYVEQLPYSLSESGNKALKGVGNFILEVKDNKNDSIATLLYCLDSGSYSPTKGIGGYAWFDPNQIEWYSKESAAYTKANKGKPIPALAFFHIPVPEYAYMKADKYDKLIGHKDEKECNGKLNTGMFSAMRNSGDVMGIFVGHDHDNDYIGDYYDIALAYGRFSGGNTVYNNLGTNGCRVIDLTKGKKEFDSYIRLLGGEKINEVKYPDTFDAQKEKKEQK